MGVCSFCRVQLLVEQTRDILSPSCVKRHQGGRAAPPALREARARADRERRVHAAGRGQ